MLSRLVFCFFVAFLSVPPAWAGTWQIHLTSEHYIEGDWNERNPGLGYLWGGDVIGAIGIARNSVDRVTLYGMAGRRYELGPIDTRVGLGGATGYLNKPVPMIAAQANYGYATVTAVPGAFLLSVELD